MRQQQPAAATVRRHDSEAPRGSGSSVSRHQPPPQQQNGAQRSRSSSSAYFLCFVYCEFVNATAATCGHIRERDHMVSRKSGPKSKRLLSAVVQLWPVLAKWFERQASRTGLAWTTRPRVLVVRSARLLTAWFRGKVVQSENGRLVLGLALVGP